MSVSNSSGIGSQSLTGVQTLELVPDTSAPGVVSRVRRAVTTAKKLRAAVAYWCLDSNKVERVLATRLSGDGFLCVDIHLPTDIDELDRLNRAGANVYLHLREPNPQPGELKARVPPHLMHAKILLFDRDDNAELWVGSHNWTARALSGLNLEASTVARLTQFAPMYTAAVEMLESIRRLCLRFNGAHVAYYKWLQGQSTDDVEWVVEVESDSPSTLAALRLTLYLNAESDYKSLKKVDQDILLSVRDTNSGAELLYEATVVDTGHLTRAGVAFDRRLHAFHLATSRPRVEGPTVPDPARLQRSLFWATLDIGEKLSEDSASFELPPTERWIADPEEIFERRVRKEDRQLFDKPDRLLVSVATDADAYYRGGPPSGRETEGVHAITAELPRGWTLLRKKRIRRLKRR